MFASGWWRDGGCWGRTSGPPLVLVRVRVQESGSANHPAEGGRHLSQQLFHHLS